MSEATPDTTSNRGSHHSLENEHASDQIQIPSDLQDVLSTPTLSQKQALGTQTLAGARLLAKSGFHEGKYSKDIVDSSFKKSKSHREKLYAQKPAERRVEAYLRRIDRTMSTHGSHFEQRLWRESAKKLITREEDIPESYWRSQEQILRDNGRGDTHLSQSARHAIVDGIQESQQQSLESWSDYLGHEDCSYPTWFKLYAWDGMSKMGVFDKKKGEFRKRDKSTVAPYPRLNEAVLAKTYGIVSNFYDIGEEQTVDTNLSEKQLKQLVDGGSFNRLYSKLLLEQKAAPEVPKNPEDIRGGWVEYLPGEEENLATAAEGTPWCVASPDMGRRYLEDENYSRDGKNKAKFILFHLTDPETGTLAENACASIRLNTDGNVAEISGLKDGQALDDALVPTVEKKVKTLPGGEKFLEALADKKMLMALDRKMQVNKLLTDDEYEFLYEAERPIRQADTYRRDPRIDELRKHYGKLSGYLDSGARISRNVAYKFSADELINNFDRLNQSLINSRIVEEVKEEYLVNVYDDYYEERYGEIELGEGVDRITNVRGNETSPSREEKRTRVKHRMADHTPITAEDILNNTCESMSPDAAVKLFLEFGIKPDDIFSKVRRVRSLEDRIVLARRFNEEGIQISMHNILGDEEVAMLQPYTLAELMSHVEELEDLGIELNYGELYGNMSDWDRIETYSQFAKNVKGFEGGEALREAIEHEISWINEPSNERWRRVDYERLADKLIDMSQYVNNANDSEILFSTLTENDSLYMAAEDNDNVDNLREARIRTGVGNGSQENLLADLLGGYGQRFRPGGYRRENLLGSNNCDVLSTIQELTSRGFDGEILGDYFAERWTHTLKEANTHGKLNKTTNEIVSVLPVLIGGNSFTPERVMHLCSSTAARPQGTIQGSNPESVCHDYGGLNPEMVFAKGRYRNVKHFDGETLQLLIDTFSEPNDILFQAVKTLESAGVSARAALEHELEKNSWSHAGESVYARYSHNGYSDYYYEITERKTPAWTSEDFVRGITNRIYDTLEKHRITIAEYDLDDNPDAITSLRNQVEAIDFENRPEKLIDYLPALADNVVFNYGGLDINARIAKVTSGQVRNIDELVSRTPSELLSDKIETLVENGAHPNQIVTSLKKEDLIRRRDLLISVGADADYIDAIIPHAS